MITYKRDCNIFEDDADVLTNPVNCKGKMGKGLALAFVKTFPDIIEPYKFACKSGALRPSTPVLLNSTTTRPAILLFPTKDDWRGKSRIEWIDEGLRYVADHLADWNIRSIAIPPLGCGLGGLDWKDVKPAIDKHLGEVDLDVRVHEP